MEPELKRKWVDALRSGKFERGNGRLKADSKYCCLGVLRHIANPRDKRRAAHAHLLHSDQLAEFGLSNSEQTKLADMNDNGKTFSEIADYIEKRI